MQDSIIILDGSRMAHIDSTLHALEEIESLRQVPQKIWKSWDMEFINSFIGPAYNSSRDQVDIFELGSRLSLNSWLHRENQDSLKILITDQDLYDSRNKNLNFGFGVNLPFESGSNYVIVSTARLGDETHLRHLLAHELGHAFGAPNPSRPGVYNSLGAHCPDRNCTMHQELSGTSSYQQALRVSAQGSIYCSDCAGDIQRYGK